MTRKKEKKAFSMRRKFLFIFGTFTFITSVTLAVFAIRVARQAVTEKVESHLIDKATDTAEIIDGRIEALFQFIENIADISMIISENVSISEKLAYLKKITTNRTEFTSINIADCDGNLYLPGKTINVSKQNWYPIVMSGERFISEPFISAANGQLIIVLAIPTYDENRKINGALNVSVGGSWLSKQIDDIVIGKTGACSILGLQGTTIAHRNIEFVEKQENIFETVKSNPAFKSLAVFCNNAITSKESAVGFYELFGEKNISSFAKMKSTGWTIIISAPTDEFMGTIVSLRNRMLIVGLSILTVNLIILFFIVRTMVKPINVVVKALKDIAQGEGDLTVRLPLVGSQEIINLSQFFNKTIEKIGSAVKTVGENSQTMENIGTELASNMIKTAHAVQQISAAIDGVKQQTLTQAASVTETASTVEEIIRTIKQLNSSIENQAASVAESSSAIEQMVGNIASITQTLDKTNDVVKKLATATAAGRETITGSMTVTQKVAEESGGLLEASNVIQHIASQTNLLAMNAAIEAAHAGESGKGFAVVADEIRKLAEESSTQGKTITSTLKVLSGEIETLSDSAKTAEEKFNAIFALSEQVKTMSQNLMDAMREQENGSKEVLTAIRDINIVTNQVNDGSAEMLRGGENVATEMRKLDELTRVITDSMNEMTSGAIQISNAVQDVNEISQKNKHSIENLSKEVGKFKV